ncbi:class I adenylate-forming enzyme family protein [Novosphingobium sp. Fuku2-ISO-50]|uniref:class I adenylate-forming enzyme family protein n=1 Tax=Novosphingobium sp. Fuku2-ISO-50 TaxID=1739114 RepID=UPI00076C9357|nr:class I adenylate-forming enzyme family protein [Novosphingobium sp. Fuku2-ISO-50]KUR76687.1 AMP-dependent synthetase [Novosphingobium sp. Fuku2-ISO-50]
MSEIPASMRISVSPLADMLLKSWDRVPHKEALVFPTGRRSYDDVVQSVLRRARGLIGLGIAPGDHVGILLPSGVEFIETLFAVAMVGGVSVLMNARYRAPEVRYVVENADLVAVVTNSEADEFVDFVARMTEAFPALAQCDDAPVLADAPKLRRLILHGGKHAPGFTNQAAFDRATERTSEAAVHEMRLAVRLRDTCMILYTSGTSDKPKGCLLSNEAICREVSNLARNRWAFGPDERVWSPMPLFHIAAMLAMLGAIEVGGTYIGQPHFDPGESLRQIEAEKATMVFLPFVTFHQAMIAHPDWDKTDMRSVRLMNSCFSQMPRAVGEAYRAKMPDALQVGTFGMSEACGVVTTGGYDMDPELGFEALGYPLKGVSLRVVDLETGADLPVGERGEIWIRGYNMLDGYYRDPQKTAEALDADGWYHSGDIGSLDANGHLRFHGRFKDMLKVGGENVAAAEVEAVLSAHEAVELAQVIGIPDPRLEEVPAAYIKLHSDQSVDPDALIAFVRDRLASFKVPRHVRFVDEWPMSASKIQKFKLRQQLMAELGLAD